ncbi:hypothetical protein V5738_10880 [Salinisphaera sp. SPP-AMP-43]|uniref:phage major capsid protein n=1 Tax=Salinisphaera sp. SPP-AMP-43 TaxID=3121288 RepID=UPI003C6E58EB
MAGPASVSGHPNYSSDGPVKFIPAFWAGKLRTKFYRSTCFGEIANTEYEGIIAQQGDGVWIRTEPDVDIKDYQRGQDLEYEDPASDSVWLPIDEAKYFGFKVNDIDRYQSDIDMMDTFTDSATQRMGVAIDRSILGTKYAEVDPVNAGNSAGKIQGDYELGEPGAPKVLTPGNILDFIVDMNSVLDEQDVDPMNRWIVLPTWATNMLKKSDLRNADAMGDDTSVIRNGRIGMIDQTTLYKSNNMSTVNDADAGGQKITNMMFGHKSALTFASQMTEMEELPHPTKFGRLVRGLNVYGCKVIAPEYMGHGYIAKG